MTIFMIKMTYLSIKSENSFKNIFHVYYMIQFLVTISIICVYSKNLNCKTHKLFYLENNHYTNNNYHWDRTFLDEIKRTYMTWSHHIMFCMFQPQWIGIKVVGMKTIFLQWNKLLNLVVLLSPSNICLDFYPTKFWSNWICGLYYQCYVYLYHYFCLPPCM